MSKPQQLPLKKYQHYEQHWLLRPVFLQHEAHVVLRDYTWINWFVWLISFPDRAM